MKALRLSLASATIVLGLASLAPAENAPISGSELASKLSALEQDGTSYVRLKLDVKQGNASKATYQLQIKQRRTAAGTEVLYQVLFPREQKGESILVRQSGGKAPSGIHFTPPDKTQNLEGAKLREAFLGSDLAYGDLVENFYAWPKQTIVGSEEVNGTSCQILESKGGSSAYGSVKSWIDTRHMVPLKVEKYSSSGQLVRRVDTTNVESDDKGRHLPAGLLIRRGGGETATVIEGSRIKHDVTIPETTFSPEGMKDISAPH